MSETHKCCVDMEIIYLDEADMAHTEEDDDRDVLSLEHKDTRQEQQAKFRAEWTDAPTKYLINIYKENVKFIGKNRKFATYNKLWEFVSKQMENEGYMFTSAQIKQKWDALVRCYKDTVNNNNKTGRKRKICPYQTELNEVLQKKKNIFPEFIAVGSRAWNCTMDVNETPSTSNATEVSESSESTSTTSTPKAKSFYRSPTRKIREQIERHHQEKMAALNQWRAKKLEFLKLCEENRQQHRRQLIDLLRNNNKN